VISYSVIHAFHQTHRVPLRISTQFVLSEKRAQHRYYILGMVEVRRPATLISTSLILPR